MILLEEILKTKRPSHKMPVWFMRQAGRYLPEYRELRSRHTSFLDFCGNPQGAATATLQPLSRFDLDAAIIFSDILVVPAAMSQQVSFLQGEGPRLSPLRSLADLDCLTRDPVLWKKYLSATLEALKIVRQDLAPEKALIGFAGAPWTVACYMVEGGGSKSFEEARLFFAHNPLFFDRLMMDLVDITAQYLIWQVESGANVLKLFDSWAGHCPAWLISSALEQPVAEIIRRVKAACPDVPVLYFPKGAGEKSLSLGRSVGADGLALDQFTDPLWVRDEYRRYADAFVLQGGLDPLVMVAGGDRLKQEIYRYLDAFKGLPYIFNLGHGMIPSMPIEHVSQTITHVRSWEAENL